MTKGELTKMAGYENQTIDYALPQKFFDDCVKIGIIEPLLVFAGWIYDDQSPIFGRPLPMSELWAKYFERRANSQ